MLRFLLPFLFFLPFSYGKQWRMMLIYGKPGITNKYFISTIGKSMEECYTLCYNTDNCAVSYYYGTTCQLFKFGNFTITQWNSSSTGSIVGIKRHLQDDQCPDLSNPYYTSTDTWKGAQNFSANLIKISKNGTDWSINYSTFECDNRTQLFRRGNYWVCVGARAFDGCGAQKFAGGLCGGSLTAPYNLDEWQYFDDAKGTYPGYTTALWSDGKGKVFADKTLNGNVVGYGTNWNDTDCPYIDNGRVLSTNPCTKSTRGSTPGGTCFHGAACLMRSLKIN